ncbi:MAG: response regulator [SAR324 cluster bacterium]|nr:response regulator [SAR324 cluster bacterium]
MKNEHPDKSKYHILVVDDEPIVRDITTKWLKRTPHHIDSAIDGEDALEKWQNAIGSSHPYDLMIVDLNMPRMDGKSLIHHVRQKDQGISLIILTGYGELSDAYDFLEKYQISDFLNKPVEYSRQFLFSVENALEKRRLYQQLSDYANSLESAYDSLKERSAELENAVLAAQRASQAKSDFLANMSHEIRTPMNSILIMAELLEETTLNLDQQDYVGRLKNSGKSLLKLINNILDLSKIEAGMLETNIVPFNLEGLVTETVQMMAVKAREKNIKLISYIQPEVPLSVIGEPVHLQQVLINLLGNAIKFTQSGHVRLEISSTETDEKSIRKFSFVIEDTGIGISSEQQKVIFDPFTQGESLTTRKYDGSGLGLAISKKLVEAAGGELRLKSQMGEGSIFFFELPFELRNLNKPNLVDSASTAEKPIQLETSENALPILRILVAEDSTDNRFVIEKLLGTIPCLMEMAENGKEALEKFVSSRWDVVLMDMQMPEMNGYEATRAIRDWEEKQGVPPVPIIAVTAYALKDDQQKCFQAGCTAYLSKPLTKAMFLETVLKLGNRESWITSHEFDSSDSDLKEYIPKYLKSCRENAEAILQAHLNRDFAAIFTLGHQMKGSGGAYGFGRITEFGRALAESGKTENGDEVPALAHQLMEFLDQQFAAPTELTTKELPALSNEQETHLLNEFEQLAQIPYYQTGYLVEQITKMEKLCKNFDSPHRDRLEAIKDAVFSRNPDQVSTLIDEALNR